MAVPLKEPGQLSVLFLARLHPMKGLHRLLAWLPQISGSLQLRIAGPEVDQAYASTCRTIVGHLPERIQVEWLGPIKPVEVMAEFGKAHVYVLPTETENHGYTIQEALACGCPVLTSLGTPWKDLEAYGAGWTLPLEAAEAWSGVLQDLVDLGAEAYEGQRTRTQAYGRACMAPEAAVSATRAMLEAVLRDSR
jgi:glycosyltransferase involved in cell wall biosynthesis